MELRDRWPSRSMLVASLVPQGSRVIDLGAGAAKLGERLPEGCSYFPVDLPEFNMNLGRWPEGEFDVAVMSGVLEYAEDPLEVFRRLRRLAPKAVVTYSHGGRRRKGWVTDMGPQDLTGLALEAGWGVGSL